MDTYKNNDPKAVKPSPNPKPSPPPPRYVQEGKVPEKLDERNYIRNLGKSRPANP